MKRFVFFTILISLLFTSVPVFSETPEPYEENEFPEVLKDIRRAEIITLGAMPFITFNVSLGYSFGSYAFHNFDYSYFKNPFAADSDNNYNTDEQIGIILTSLGISAGIGITDFVVHQIKRNKKNKALKKQKNKQVTITPVTQDPEAIKIENPAQQENNAPEETIEVNDENEEVKLQRSGKQLNVISTQKDSAND